jgi:hypothetical protein
MMVGMAGTRPGEMTEVALILRTLRAGCPTTAGNQATARRIEGAAVGIEATAAWMAALAADGLISRATPAARAEAARMLRALVGAMPPATGRDRAATRRIEGAALGLDVIARPVGRG